MESRPNDIMTRHIIPESMFAISNGALIILQTNEKIHEKSQGSLNDSRTLIFYLYPNFATWFECKFLVTLSGLFGAIHVDLYIFTKRWILMRWWGHLRIGVVSSKRLLRMKINIKRVVGTCSKQV